MYIAKQFHKWIFNACSETRLTVLKMEFIKSLPPNSSISVPTIFLCMPSSSKLNSRFNGIDGILILLFRGGDRSKPKHKMRADPVDVGAEVELFEIMTHRNEIPRGTYTPNHSIISFEVIWLEIHAGFSILILKIPRKLLWKWKRFCSRTRWVNLKICAKFIKFNRKLKTKWKCNFTIKTNRKWKYSFRIINSIII